MIGRMTFFGLIAPFDKLGTKKKAGFSFRCCIHFLKVRQLFLPSFIFSYHDNTHAVSHFPRLKGNKKLSYDSYDKDSVNFIYPCLRTILPKRSYNDIKVAISPCQ